MAITTDRTNDELVVLTSHELKEIHLKIAKKIPLAKHANGRYGNY